MSFNWICPHCGRDQTVVDQRYHELSQLIDVGGTIEGKIATCTVAVGCASASCNKISVILSLRPTIINQKGIRVANYDVDALYQRTALPISNAKPQPDFIPAPLIEDYIEACLILEDSPKASATLSRRCIQGMIRDFCGIKKPNLLQEIQALSAAVNDGSGPAGVTSETVEAIDHIRGIGNIGAHMERDINLIIPVESGEASLLIDLIELLFEEWYVARSTRQRKLAAISALGAEKKKLIADGRSAKPDDIS